MHLNVARAPDGNQFGLSVLLVAFCAPSHEFPSVPLYICTSWTINAASHSDPENEWELSGTAGP